MGKGGKVVWVGGHLGGDVGVGGALDRARAIEDQGGLDGVASELLVVAQRGYLLARTVQLDVPAEVGGGLEQHNVEALDTALLLHPAVQPDALVEDLQATFLASPDRRTPADEQHSVSHYFPLASQLGNVLPGLSR